MVFPDSIVNATTEPNPTATLYALVRGLKAKVTLSSVRQELARHPDFPSLLSMSDLLTDWKIDNTAVQLNTAEQLRELPFPFIAHLNKHNGWYVLVSALTGNRITYSDSQAGRKTESVDAFEKQWSGVVLVAETNGQSGEADYAVHRREETLSNLRRPFLITGAVIATLFVMLGIAPNFTVSNWLLLLTKTTGLLVSCLLVARQLGSRSALTDRLCQVGGKASCDFVLNSPGAKLWGWLSWAEVGLLYFGGSLLSVLLAGTQPNGIGSVTGPTTVWPLLHGMALLALPYTVFSIYYQARVVRQWCVLCLAVQAILLIEGIAAIMQLSPLPANWWPYAVLTLIFLVPALAWVWVKPLLLNGAQHTHDHATLLGLKRDPALFRALLMQQSPMPPVPFDLQPIVLGNPEAAHTITMVTNPFCDPCATMHRELEKLLSQNTAVKAHIIFACDGADGRTASVATRLLALAGQDKAADALTDWYAQKEKVYAAWAERHVIDGEETKWLAIALGHGDWCRTAGIDSTPTLFIDGYPLPDLYRLRECRWLINELQPTQAELSYKL